MSRKQWVYITGCNIHIRIFLTSNVTLILNANIQHIYFHAKHITIKMIHRSPDIYFKSCHFIPPNYSPPKEKWIIVCWHYPTSYYTNQAWTPSGGKWAQLQKIKKQEIPAASSTPLHSTFFFLVQLDLMALLGFLYILPSYLFSFAWVALTSQPAVHHRTIWNGRDCS